MVNHNDIHNGKLNLET